MAVMNSPPLGTEAGPHPWEGWFRRRGRFRGCIGERGLFNHILGRELLLRFIEANPSLRGRRGGIDSEVQFNGQDGRIPQKLGIARQQSLLMPLHRHADDRQERCMHQQ